MTVTEAEAAPTPFVKWAGGKRLLLPKLLPHMPVVREGARYIEPFCGGAAMFFATQPSLAVLGDLNSDLIETFRSVRDDVESVIRTLARLRNDEETYYRVRASRPVRPHTRSARFIYLNKTCFNGLYRVNTRGEFNVPFGRHGARLMVCDREQLRAASDALQGVALVNSDFESVAARANPGDVVYFDPPYTTAHKTNGFIEYNQKVFSWDDQRRLANLAATLVRQGTTVAISNADHPSITALYTGGVFKRHFIKRWSTMAGSSKSRFLASELLIVGQAAPRAGRESS